MLIRGKEKTSKDSKEKYYEILKQQKVSSSVRKPFMPSLISPILQCQTAYIEKLRICFTETK